MKLRSRSFSTYSSLALAITTVTTLAALTLTGCGFSASQGAGTGYSPTSFSGIVHGGPNPIASATITLYATQNNGYGGAGLKLGSTTTNSSGGFSFGTLTNACPAGQQAYITAAAGNTGANTTNTNSLLMAALGPCSSLSTSTNIWIDEPSTIAAAYALGNFITISGTGSAMVVGVSAPANNNGGSGGASSGACTVTSGVTTSCYAAGLAHAFLNAANLVSASNISGVGASSTTSPTGQVYATPPSNPTTLATTAVALQNLVPQQEINSLANAVQACVNSAGTTGSTDTASGCGQLFTSTTIASTYTSNTAYTTKPTNTLQALVNIAKFPFAGVSGIFTLSGTTGFYQPTLTATPPDWSVAIVFRSYTAAANQIGSVYFTTTDINDNVYATALTAPSTGSATGALPYIAHGLSSDGVGNWAAPATLLSTSSVTYTCDSWAGTAATSGACQAATDTAGHLWVGMGSTNFSGGGLWNLNQTTGAVTAYPITYSGTSYYPFGLAVDQANDLFYSSANTSGSANFWKFLSGGTTLTPVAAPSAVLAGHTSGSLAFDTAGNLFAPENSGGSVGFTFFKTSGSTSSETFSAYNNCNCLGGSTGTWPTGGMVDANNNYWMTGAASVVNIAGAADAFAVTSGSSTGAYAYTVGSSTTTLRMSSMDGAGTIFVPDNSTSGTQNPVSASAVAASKPALLLYYTSLNANVSIQGCNLAGATGNAACVTGAATNPNNGLFYQAVNAAIDSTGSLWVSSEANDAIIQVIGLAAPTWPQASYIHPATMPQ